MDVPTFRAAFPEFTDPLRYPDSMVTFWLTLAARMLRPDRWRSLLDFGIELFTAHQLCLAARQQQIAALGGIPGGVTGATSAKSVDRVSLSYDTANVQYQNAGFWNMTSYGVQFYQLLRMIGAGPLQIGIEPGGGNTSGCEGAWPGPPFWPQVGS